MGDSSISEWEIGDWVPGVSTLEHLQPDKPILFRNFSNLWHLYLGSHMGPRVRAESEASFIDIEHCSLVGFVNNCDYVPCLVSVPLPLPQVGSGFRFCILKTKKRRKELKWKKSKKNHWRSDSWDHKWEKSPLHPSSSSLIWRRDVRINLFVHQKVRKKEWGTVNI